MRAGTTGDSLTFATFSIPMAADMRRVDFWGITMPEDGKHRPRAPNRKTSARLMDGPITYAAIDLGTNSCRMLIARRIDDGFTVVDGFSRIVRLGEGLVRTGKLQDTAMERTLAALRECRNKIEFHGATRIRCVATEACRQADNGDSFMDRARRETGLTIEAITPRDEANLTVAGCAPLMQSGYPDGLLFDIGGGSTEIIWVDTHGKRTPTVRDVISIPMGVVTLVDEFGRGDLSDQDFEEIVGRISRRLKPFEKTNQIDAALERKSVQMIGTSGTMTTLGAIHLGLPRYDRTRIDGLSLDLTHVRSLTAQLSEMDFRARADIPCIGRARADLMTMGCAVLSAIVRHWPVPSIRVADRGIREGLIVGLIEADKNQARIKPRRPAA